MTRGVCLYLVGSFVLVSLAGCGRGFFSAEREPWRTEAEVAAPAVHHQTHDPAPVPGPVDLEIEAAAVTMQLVQARDAPAAEPAALAFAPNEIALLHELEPELDGPTQLQKNPHPTESLKWAAWIIAKLGGWTGYASHKPPGPITFHNGLARFQAFASGWALKNL